jgi:hypothetical protein
VFLDGTYITISRQYICLIFSEAVPPHTFKAGQYVVSCDVS